jgi:23S rRNA G2445 N2-methylase RlmL
VLVTCSPGLAPLLNGEIEALGLKADSVHERGITVTATLRDTMRMNLHLRTAFNVLYLLKKFTSKDPEQLYRETVALPWETIISPTGYFTVVSQAENPTVRHTTYPSLKVKDAIADRIMNKTGRRPDSGPERNRVVVNLYWQDERCWLYVNTSGEKLSDRGYRRNPYKAPLRENLAAGIVMSSEYDGQCPLVLPMCGSGTLAIEAALIGLGRVPGLLRSNYGFMHLTGFDAEAWQALRKEALKTGHKKLPFRIIASDIDANAVRAARANSRTAGVDQLVDFLVCDFADTPVPVERGIVLMNPEYGERLGEVAELEKTYGRMGDFFKQRCAGYSAFIFTGNTALAKRVGLRTSRRIPFFNANIECRLLRYDMYEGSRKTAKTE